MPILTWVPQVFPILCIKADLLMSLPARTSSITDLYVPGVQLKKNPLVQFFLYFLAFFPTGESAVGKSSLVLRFVKGQFHEYQESTIGGTAVSS